MEPKNIPKNVWLKATEENLASFTASTPSEAELNIKNPTTTSSAVTPKKTLSIFPLWEFSIFNFAIFIKFSIFQFSITWYPILHHSTLSSKPSLNRAIFYTHFLIDKSYGFRFIYKNWIHLACAAALLKCMILFTEFAWQKKWICYTIVTNSH